MDNGENSELGAKLPPPGESRFGESCPCRESSTSVQLGPRSRIVARGIAVDAAPQHSQTFKAIARLAVAPLADSQGRVRDSRLTRKTVGREDSSHLLQLCVYDRTLYAGSQSVARFISSRKSAAS